MKNKKGFSLIELIVAMFILTLLLAGLVAISVSMFQVYQKSKAIKTVTEDVGYAINSIAKDVRMGKVEAGTSGGQYYSDGSTRSAYLLISRNRGGRVCYKIDAAAGFVSVADYASGTDCSGLTYTNKIVDLTGTGMIFDATTSGFLSCISDVKGDGSVFPKCYNANDKKRRGWVEINLNIESPTMATDSIRVQTTVSSRDYGWETN